MCFSSGQGDPDKMAKSRKSTSREPREIGRLLGKAGDNAVTESYLQYSRNEVPGGDTSNQGQQNAAYEAARKLARSHYWLKGFLPTKVAVYNFGLRFSAGSKSKKGAKVAKRNSKEAQSLRDWLDAPVKVAAATNLNENDVKQIGVASGAEITNRERIQKFIKDVWNEFLLLDNVIIGWTDTLPQPVVLPLEKCRYTDVLGIETLFYLHGLSEQQRKLLPPEDQERFAEPEIMFDPTEGEFFRVLKLEQTGNGLAWPSIQSIFRTIRTTESMEIGESAYAYVGKMKFRHWKKGHEIKNGAMAGKPAHFWRKENSKTIQNVFEGKIGFLGDFCSNFDFALEFPHEDQEYFDEAKWKSPEHRLIKWGGSLAEILHDKGRAADLMLILKAQVTDTRNEMARLLESVINQAFDAPVPIKIGWSNTIFNTLQLAAEDRKFGLMSGSLSQSTWRAESGFDDELESEKKEEEAALVASNPELFKPGWDMSHGDPELKKGGKPGGKADGDNKNQG
jgi:hypothetical protein